MNNDYVEILDKSNTNQINYLVQRDSSSLSNFLNCYIENTMNQGLEGAQSRFIEKMLLTNYKKYAIEKQKKETERNYEAFIAKIIDELVPELKAFSIEDSVEFSNAERKIIEVSEKYKFRELGEALQHIVKDFYMDLNVIVAVCRGLIHFDWDDVNPWGLSLIISILYHKSDVVKENALIVIDNWACKDFLPTLKGLDCSTSWLDNYVKKIIQSLE